MIVGENQQDIGLNVSTRESGYCTKTGVTILPSVTNQEPWPTVEMEDSAVGLIHHTHYLHAKLPRLTNK